MQLGYGAKRRKRVEISIEDSKTHLGMGIGMHLFCPCKDGIGGRESTRLGERPKCAFPAIKTAANGPFVSAILVPGSTCCKQRGQGDFSHGRDKLPKLLPPSHKLGELQTSPLLSLGSPPPVCAFCIGRELSGVFGSKCRLDDDRQYPTTPRSLSPAPHGK